MGEVKSINLEPSDDWYEAIILVKSGQVGENYISRERFNEVFDAFMSHHYKEAYSGFTELAEAGSAVSQYYLGTMYLHGKGVLQDFERAHMWLNVASSQGHDKAGILLEKLTKSMTSKQVADAQKRARKWVARKSDEEFSGKHDKV